MFIKIAKCDIFSLDSLIDIELINVLITHTCIIKHNKLKANAQQTEDGCRARVNVPKFNLW